MKAAHEPVLTKPYLARVYDSIEFTLASGLTNYDLRANEAAAFENLEAYTTISIRSDQGLTLRVNNTAYRGITVVANRAFELDDLIEITDIYLSNASGSTANVKVIGTRKGAL